MSSPWSLSCFKKKKSPKGNNSYSMSIQCCFSLRELSLERGSPGRQPRQPVQETKSWALVWAAHDESCGHITSLGLSWERAWSGESKRTGLKSTSTSWSAALGQKRLCASISPSVKWTYNGAHPGTFPWGFKGVNTSNTLSTLPGTLAEGCLWKARGMISISLRGSWWWLKPRRIYKGFISLGLKVTYHPTDLKSSPGYRKHSAKDQRGSTDTMIQEKILAINQWRHSLTAWQLWKHKISPI